MTEIHLHFDGGISSEDRDFLMKLVAYATEQKILEIRAEKEADSTVSYLQEAELESERIRAQAQLIEAKTKAKKFELNSIKWAGCKEVET